MADQPLRVVMPILTFVPGGMGGSETYVKALVAQLQSRDDVQLTVIASQAGADAVGARAAHVVANAGGGGSALARLATIVGGARGDRGTRRLMREADVVHYPFTVPVPLPPRGTPWLLTVHDVQHRDLPEMFSLAERAYRALAYDAPARRATRVITVSEFCREQINRHLGVPPEQIDVAHLGVDLDRFTPNDGPREPFVLYPATAWPHKNHARLVAAVDVVRRTHPEMRLVLTGGRRATLGDLPAWAEHRGQVSEDELAELYRTASCLAFPSLYEGFGLPPLEAMASGCPVAAANTGALPEVCGAAAVLYDAGDVCEIAAGIATALDSGYRDRGLGRVRRFTWSACADAHVASFHAANVIRL